MAKKTKQKDPNYIGMLRALSQADQTDYYAEPKDSPLEDWQRLPMTRSTGIYRTAIGDENSRAYAKHQAEMKRQGIDLEQFKKDRSRNMMPGSGGLRYKSESAREKMAKKYGKDWYTRFPEMIQTDDRLREAARGSFGGGFSNIGSRRVTKSSGLGLGALGGLLGGDASDGDTVLDRQKVRGKVFTDTLGKLIKAGGTAEDVANVLQKKGMSPEVAIKQAAVIMNEIIPSGKTASKKAPAKRKDSRVGLLYGSEDRDYDKAGAYRFWDKDDYSKAQAASNKKLVGEYVTKASAAKMNTDEIEQLKNVMHPSIRAAFEKEWAKVEGPRRKAREKKAAANIKKVNEAVAAKKGQRTALDDAGLVAKQMFVDPVTNLVGGDNLKAAGQTAKSMFWDQPLKELNRVVFGQPTAKPSTMNPPRTSGNYGVFPDPGGMGDAPPSATGRPVISSPPGTILGANTDAMFKFRPPTPPPAYNGVPPRTTPDRTFISQGQVAPPPQAPSPSAREAALMSQSFGGDMPQPQNLMMQISDQTEQLAAVAEQRAPGASQAILRAKTNMDALLSRAGVGGIDMSGVEEILRWLQEGVGEDLAIEFMNIYLGRSGLGGNRLEAPQLMRR